jgi:tRNA A37 N6-isopentenylltransferase MiaA
MKITKEMLAYALKANNNDPIRTSEAIEKYQQTYDKILKLKQSQKKLEEDFQYNLKVIEKDIEKERNSCEHPMQTHHYGDHDNPQYNTCNVCNKEL